MFYPEGFDKGVARCRHPKLRAPAGSEQEGSGLTAGTGDGAKGPGEGEPGEGRT